MRSLLRPANFARSVVTAAALGLTLAPLCGQKAQGLSLEQAVTMPWTLQEPLPERLWMPGGQRFSTMHPHRRDRVLAHTVGADDETVLFTATQINAALTAAGAKMPGARNRMFFAFTWHTEDTVRVQRPEGIYHWKLGTKRATRVLPLPEGAAPIACAADDRSVAFLHEKQLHIQAGTSEPKRITKDGSDDIVYGGAAHRAEFGIHDGLWWGPRGRLLAFFREDLGPIQKYPYVDHTTMPPKAIHGRYPMAGTANSHVQVGVYDTKTEKLVYLKFGEEKDVYWTNVTFAPDGSRLFVAIVNRAQNHTQLVAFDPLTGRAEKVLFHERDDKWTEPEHGPIHLGDGTGRFLWFSPRKGFRHLYLYAADGKLLRQVTSGKFDVQKFLGIHNPRASADKDRSVLFEASGSDPRQMHLHRVSLAGGKCETLTATRGWHAIDLNADATHAIDTCSNLNLPGQSQILALDAKPAQHSHRVRAKSRFPGKGKQEFFEVLADDGTPLHGTVIFPPGADRTAQSAYPALLYVYGGPHSQLVKDQWLGGSSPWLHYMATRGFVVCTLDNRGTDNRGIRFAQSTFRRLSILETKDQLCAVEYLKELGCVDPKRIGVHGWSYGGYMTLNLMLRSPGTFACAISGAPVTDWAQYETGYTERYMDTPNENPLGYSYANVLTLANRLRGRLMIVHGTDDKTVMWSHSLALADRLIAAGKLFDYQPYPMQKHGVRGPGRLHLYRTMTRYLEDHLRRR